MGKAASLTSHKAGDSIASGLSYILILLHLVWREFSGKVGCIAANVPAGLAAWEADLGSNSQNRFCSI
jgi:hypothetical protein